LHCKSLGIKLEWSADSDDAACCNGPKKLAPGSQKEKWKGIEKDKIKERKKLDSAHVIKDVSRAQACMIQMHHSFHWWDYLMKIVILFSRNRVSDMWFSSET